MYMDTLEDIFEVNQYHPRINRIDARYKICDHILKRQAEWKRVLLSTQNMSKVLHEVFKAIVNDISQALPILGESGS